MPLTVLLTSITSMCALSCGDGGTTGGGACAAIASCGGELSGQWDVDSECLAITPPFEQPECAEAVREVAVTIQGTVTYTPSDTDTRSGTQRSAISYSFRASEHYSDACLKALGFEGASVEACRGIEMLWAGAAAVSCAATANDCQCDLSDAQDATVSEPFAVDGKQLVLSGSDRVDYCRSGDRLVEAASTASGRAVVTMHRHQP